MAKIEKVHARQILDSRGEPTIEVEITLDDGSMGRAAVPSGASTGAYEAIEIRDGDPEHYLGKSVMRAVENVQGEIKDNIVGLDIEQEAMDSLLNDIDGTPNKENLGANAILGVSLAYAWAQANSQGIPLYKHISNISGGTPSLPTPMFNIMNGGKHANWSTDIQEFMIIVQNKKYADQVETASEIFHHLEKVLKGRGLSTNVGNEGGFAPGFANNEEALETIAEAVDNAGYKLGEDIMLGLDVAATEFYDIASGKYKLNTENRTLDASEWASILDSWIQKYPFASIEDPFSEDDWNSWNLFNEKYGDSIQVVGDDLLVTNTERIQRAITEKSCNALLVKVNQIGTLSETLAAMEMSTKAGWNNIVSHRSGETEDITIAHLVVGTGAGQIKTGAPSRGERTAKYNELLRIAEEV